MGLSRSVPSLPVSSPWAELECKTLYRCEGERREGVKCSNILFSVHFMRICYTYIFLSPFCFLSASTGAYQRGFITPSLPGSLSDRATYISSEVRVGSSHPGTVRCWQACPCPGLRCPPRQCGQRGQRWRTRLRACRFPYKQHCGSVRFCVRGGGIFKCLYFCD